MNSFHLEEIEYLAKEMGVNIFKYYMFYKALNLKGRPPENRVESDYLLSDIPYNLGLLMSIMEKVASLKDYGARVSIHAEDPELIMRFSKQVQNSFEKNRINELEAYHLSRPPEVETFAIIEAMYLACMTKCPITLLHISSEGGINTAWNLKQQLGVDAVLETTLHHLTLDTSYGSKLAKVNPPIRPQSDVDALWKYINLNRVDTIVSDHAATLSSMKEPDIWNAEPGFAGSSLFAQILYTEGFVKRGIPIERLIQLVTLNPAKVTGLWPRKGDIALGADADIVVIDPKKELKVKTEMLNSGQDYTPFERMVFRGWPILTVVRGNVVMEDGEINSDKPKGEYIKRPAKKPSDKNII